MFAMVSILTNFQKKNLVAPTTITVFNSILQIWTKFWIISRECDCIRSLNSWEIHRIDFLIKNTFLKLIYGKIWCTKCLADTYVSTKICVYFSLTFFY